MSLNLNSLQILGKLQPIAELIFQAEQATHTFSAPLARNRAAAINALEGLKNHWRLDEAVQTMEWVLREKIDINQRLIAQIGKETEAFKEALACIQEALKAPPPERN